MATYTWNGQLGTEWDVTAGMVTNWDGPGMQPIPGNNDIAIINTAATITTDNGGGFVFDCRGILNPGRFEEFKKLTGRDKPVKDFLEQRTKMPDFLNSVFDIADISVADYINRGFSHLLISFGCTGGQHRSVYAADALARHLKNKFHVKIDLHHRVQDEKNWINE